MTALFQRLSTSPLFRNTFVYVFCDGINRAIPFLLLPFITHYLTPADYGVVTNFNVYVQILSVFYLSTAGALPVMFYKLGKEELQRYVFNMIMLNTYAVLLCIVVLGCSYAWTEQVLGLPLLFQLLSLVMVWFAGITYLNMLLWRCEEKPLSFGIYQISQSAVNAVTTILFVIILLMGWKGRVYSMAFATIVFGLVSIYVLYKRHYLYFKVDRNFQWQMLVFALPLVPHALSFWLKSGVDKVMLTNMCDLTANGLYSVAMTWGSIVAMFMASFSNAYTPYLYKKLARFDSDRVGTADEQCKLVKLIGFCILSMLAFVAIVWGVSAYLIRIIYASSYHASLEYLPWVMLGQFFYGGYLMFVSFVHYTLKTKVLGAITFSWSIAQVGITYSLILWIGAVGAAISSAIVSAATFVFVAGYAMRVYRLPWLSLVKLRM